MGFRSLLFVTVLICTITVCLSIMGGRDARRGAWPWMVYLEIHIRDGPGVYYHGGSLISDQWVMTAAYVREHVDLERSFARVGELSLKEPSGKVIKLKRVVLHPDLNNLLENDFALVQLQEAVCFSDTVAPVVLPSPREFFSANAECWVTGWGHVATRQELGGKQTLQEVQVSLVDEATCLKSWPRPYKTHNELCAGDLEGGKGTCWGDQGGPLVCCPTGEVERRFVQVGILISGWRCGSKGDTELYARVYSHLQFIQDTIMESECQKWPQFEACFG